MKVLLIGSGGRENAIAHSLSLSPSLTKLFIAPGNPGTKKYGENCSIDISKQDNVISFCKEKNIDLIVIGPEKPLVDGLADKLIENEFKVFGPTAKAAEIEGSKVFSKSFMKQFNIPTAEYREFNSDETEAAKAYLKETTFPCVIKADGLAAGKGVIICNNYEEGASALKIIFSDKVFGSAGNKIIIEEFMEGEEASIFAITDGEKYICLPSAQDHKRIGNNDTGKNTGGMGAYSPAPVITAKLLDEIEQDIITPTLKGMAEVGRKFVGCLYCGLMITKKGPKVVEYNCRFGDPETQAVLPLVEGDLLELFNSAASGYLAPEVIKYSGGSAVCVVAASSGYPDSFPTGFEISGLDIQTPDVIITHAGTKEENNKILTAGGRVLGITAVIKENNIKTAKQTAYDAISKINYNGIYYRTDIADKAINRTT